MILLLQVPHFAVAVNISNLLLVLLSIGNEATENQSYPELMH